MTTSVISLIDIIEQHLASNQIHLPVFPPLAIQIKDMLAQPNCDIRQIAVKISEDQSLTSHMLRVANSSFFTGLSKVSTIKDAIMRLGSKQSTNVVLMVAQKQSYTSQSRAVNDMLKMLWKHAVSCSLGAKWLTEQCGHRSLAEEAFLAGLLHDIGKLFLLKVLEDIHLSSKYDVALSTSSVLEILESQHAEQGAQLLQRWNLPEPFCIVARDHQKEHVDRRNVVLCTIRLADMACHKLGIGMRHDPTIVLPATFEAQALGFSELQLAELEVMLEDAVAIA